MRFALDRLPTDPVLLQKMLLEMADVMEQERAELTAAQATVKAQTLRIEKLEHRVARLLRVQFGRSSEKMDIAQLRLMFEEVDAPEPANDEVAAPLVVKSARKSGAVFRFLRTSRVIQSIISPARAVPVVTGRQYRSTRLSLRSSTMSLRASGSSVTCGQDWCAGPANRSARRPLSICRCPR